MTPITKTIDGIALMRKARNIGDYYGFEHLSEFTNKRKGFNRIIKNFPDGFAPKDLNGTCGALAQITKVVASYDELTPNRPVFVWNSNITPGRPIPQNTTISFAAFGVKNILSEALLIRAAYAFAKELNLADKVSITSLGDEDTKQRYKKDLAQYFQKVISSLSPDVQVKVKNDPLGSAVYLASHPEETPMSVPSALEHLSEPSRIRFETLLDHLDASGTDYELANHLDNPSELFSNTRFAFVGAMGERFGEGARFSALAKKFKRTAEGAIGAVFSFQSPNTNKCPSFNKNRKDPSLVFLQLGPEAKKMSFSILESLRENKIPVVQTIYLESLQEQIDMARRYNAPYHLIIGHKEALDGTIILRDIKNHSQEIYPKDKIMEIVNAL